MEFTDPPASRVRATIVSSTANQSTGGWVGGENQGLVQEFNDDTPAVVSAARPSGIRNELCIASYAQEGRKSSRDL